MTERENIITFPTRKEFEAEAVLWFVLLGRDDVTDKQRVDFERWLNQSDRHREAFESISGLWEDLAQLSELKDIGESYIRHPEAHRRLATRRAVIAFAASAMPITFGGVYWFNRRRESLESRDVATRTGEQRTINLADGSSVILNTNSLLQIAFSREERSVRLLEGEAYFRIAKESIRPFVVYASNRAARAVGTAFSVRLRNKTALELTVEEGRVALYSIDEQEPDASLKDSAYSTITEITARQSITYDDHVKRLEILEPADLSRKLAWKKGMLAYAGEPLGNVIDDVSRYTEVKIEITDPQLRALPVAGFFKLGETEALLDSLELTFGLTVERLDPNHVKLSRALGHDAHE